jgi:hypothetical protein
MVEVVASNIHFARSLEGSLNFSRLESSSRDRGRSSLILPILQMIEHSSICKPLIYSVPQHEYLAARPGGAFFSLLCMFDTFSRGPGISRFEELLLARRSRNGPFTTNLTINIPELCLGELGLTPSRLSAPPP